MEIVLGIYQSRQTSVEEGIKFYGKQKDIWATKTAMADDLVQESFRRLEEYKDKIIKGQKEFSSLFEEENERLGRLVRIRDQCREQEDTNRKTKDYLEWVMLS